MAKAKTTVEIVTEYFQGIRYYEDEDGDKLIVILPEGLKEKKSDLDDGDLNMKLVMDDLKDIEFLCIFTAPKAAKEVLVLRAEDAKEFDS